MRDKPYRETLMKNRTLVVSGIAVTAALFLGTGCTTESPPESPHHAAPEPSPGDWMAMYEQYVATQTESLQSRGIEVPTDAEFVQFVAADEWGVAQAECMQEQGFEAEASDDGLTWGGPLPPEDQHDAHWQATYRCRLAYPVHPRFDQPLTDEQIRVIYDYFVNELVVCLEDAGYEVAPPQSWETFRSHYSSPERWEPYDSVQATSEQEHNRIREVCPPRPPLEDVYGVPD